MTSQIRGIHRTSLWNAWKAIRAEIKRCSVRDVVDHIEYDIDPDVWINRLLHRLRSGHYEPETPLRFSLAKSNGFSRRMTMPSILDLVLYRAIADCLYSKMRRFEHRHVYFERGIVPSGRRVARTPQRQRDVWKQLSEDVWDYGTIQNRTYRAWLAYDQYRKFLVFKRIHPYIVTTDVTNFFDSILYSRIADSLQGISVAPRLIGLLFFLLERLSIRDAFNESPRIGLPVDEFGCSRKLAHLTLFPHDDRMTSQFGEDAFVRWMDDQNVGVASYADGLRALAAVGSSLSRLHLTANAKKSTILSISEARRHFHLDLNKLLDKADEIDTKTPVGRRALGKAVRQVWKRASAHEGIGNWEKILKRLYRLAGLADLRFFRRRAKRDLLKHPDLSDRIADYMRCTGTNDEYLDFVEDIWCDERQVYVDVNRVLVESLLRLEPTSNEAKRLRKLASRLLRNEVAFAGAKDVAALAPLLMLRFSDRRSLSLLRTVIEGDRKQDPEALLRSCAIVFAGYGAMEARSLRRTASKLLRNHLSGMSKLLDSIEDYADVPKRFNSRLDTGYDSLKRIPFVDMRSVASARLLSLNGKSNVKAWLVSKKKTLQRKDISDYDKKLLTRLWPS